jgi:hypothetical protein
MKQRIHQERLQYEAGAASIGQHDTSEETLRLLEQATVAAIVGMDEKSQSVYEKDLSTIVKGLKELEERPCQLPRERVTPMTAQDLVEFVDHWDEENKNIPLMQSDFLFLLCRALQFPILDNLEVCLKRVSDVLVSQTTLDYLWISDLR